MFSRLVHQQAWRLLNRSFIKGPDLKSQMAETSKAEKELLKETTDSRALNIYNTLEIKSSINHSLLQSLDSYFTSKTKIDSDNLEILSEEALKIISKNCKLSPELIKILTEACASYTITNPSSIKILKVLQHLIPLSDTQHNDFKLVIKRLSVSRLNKFDMGIIKEILVTFSPMYSKPETFLATMQGEELLKLCQKVILTKLPTCKPEEYRDLAGILRVYVKNQKGVDSFITSLEQIIFTNLDQLATEEVINLFSDYKYKLTNDYEYFIYKINAPVVEYFISRFEKISLRHLTDVFDVLWNRCRNFGTYFDPRMTEKIKELLQSNNLKILSTKDSLALHLNILAYSSYTNILDEELALQVYNNLASDFLKCKESTLIHFAYYFSEFLKIPDQFWRNIYNNLELSLTSQMSYKGIFYMMLVSLKISNPVMQSMIYNKFPSVFLEWMTERLRIERVKSVSMGREGLDQRLVMEVLGEMNIRFQKEYFDIYSIDIAMPDKKIGFEICGPSHYIWPSGELNGSTLKKKKILEFADWKIFIIQFNLTINSKIRKEQIKNEVTSALKSINFII